MYIYMSRTFVFNASEKYKKLFTSAHDFFLQKKTFLQYKLV